MGTPGETKRNETSDDSPHSLTTTTTTTTAARVDAARSTRKNARSIPSLGRSRRSFGRFRRKGKSIHPRRELFEPFEPFAFGVR